MELLLRVYRKRISDMGRSPYCSKEGLNCRAWTIHLNHTLHYWGELGRLAQSCRKLNNGMKETKIKKLTWIITRVKFHVYLQILATIVHRRLDQVEIPGWFFQICRFSAELTFCFGIYGHFLV